MDDPSVSKRVVFASAFGNFVEWYDWTIYLLAAKVLSKVFFPVGNDSAALLNTLALFALAFVLRPLGGILVGGLSDKFGRQRVLAGTILMMSLSTAAIGLLPSYATVGWISFVLLLTCRLVGSLSAGGELVGSVSFLIEHLPPSRRGRSLGLLAAGVRGGALFAALMVVGLSQLMGPAFTEWGWRLLFLMALPLGIIGLFIRYKVGETPEFTALAEERGRTGLRAPGLVETLQREWRRMLVSFSIVAGFALLSYTALSGYAQVVAAPAGVAGAAAGWLAVTTLSVWTLVSLVSGRLMHRVGRTTSLLIGSAIPAVLIVPIFLIAREGGVTGAFVGAAVVGLIAGLTDSALYATTSEIFPVESRVTAGSIAYNLGTIAFGGTAPYVLVLLATKTGSTLSAAWYVAIVLALTFAAILVSRRLRQPV